MKRVIEVNALSNIKVSLDVMVEKQGDNYILDQKTYDVIQEELRLLEIYMRSYNKAINDGVQTPYWHEIKAQHKK